MFCVPGKEKERAERLCGDRRTPGSDTLRYFQQDSQQHKHGMFWLVLEDIVVPVTYPSTDPLISFQRLARLPKGPMLHFKVLKVNVILQQAHRGASDDSLTISDAFEVNTEMSELLKVFHKLCPQFYNNC